MSLANTDAAQMLCRLIATFTLIGERVFVGAWVREEQALTSHVLSLSFVCYRLWFEWSVRMFLESPVYRLCAWATIATVLWRETFSVWDVFWLEYFDHFRNAINSGSRISSDSTKLTSQLKNEMPRSTRNRTEFQTMGNLCADESMNSDHFDLCWEVCWIHFCVARKLVNDFWRQ